MPQHMPDNNFSIKFAAVAGIVMATMFILLMTGVTGPVSWPPKAYEATSVFTPEPPTSTPQPAISPLTSSQDRSSATRDDFFGVIVAMIAVGSMMIFTFIFVVFLSVQERDTAPQQAPEQIIKPASDVDIHERERLIQLEKRLYHRENEMRLAKKESERQHFWHMKAVEHAMKKAEAAEAARKPVREATADHPAVRNSRRSRTEEDKSLKYLEMKSKTGKNGKAKTSSNGKHQRD